MAYNGPGDSETIGGGFATGGGAGLIGGIIGAGAGLYDSYQNRKAAAINTNKTIAAQKAEAELAYQRSVQMWNAQNLYNTPEAQMQRFGAAGLNPHLIYGQGSSGLASSPPQYQAANLQYRYEAPAYGAAIQTILPTLMAVGSWLQNMRATEAGIRKTEVDTGRSETETQRARQLIDYLMLRNPQVLKEGMNKLSLFPYQKSMQHDAAIKSTTVLSDIQQEYRLKHGEELFSGLPFRPGTPLGELGGLSKEKFLQERAKTKLEQARASWTDFDITNPQALMQLVLSGVMGLAGSTLKLQAGQSFNARQRKLDRRHDMVKARINQRRR